MRDGRTLNSALLIGSLAVGLASSAYAGEGVRRTTTTEASYNADAVEATEIQRWLLQHPRYQDGVMIGDPQSLGEVTLVVSRSQSGDSAMAAPDGQPGKPLPSNGAQGDQVSITSVGDGVSQTWDYTWREGSPGDWVLVGYQTSEVPS